MFEFKLSEIPFWLKEESEFELLGGEPAQQSSFEISVRWHNLKVCRFIFLFTFVDLFFLQGLNRNMLATVWARVRASGDRTHLNIMNIHKYHEYSRHF